VLVIAVIGLNILHSTGKTTIVTQMQGTVREWAPDVFDALFPCVSSEQKAEQPASDSQQPAEETAGNGVIAPAPVAPVT